MSLPKVKQEIRANDRQGLPIYVIRKILRNLLKTFAFLEDINIIHGDLKVQ
jgi:hypothetical protein